jgi:hypothetical protein
MRRVDLLRNPAFRGYSTCHSAFVAAAKFSQGRVCDHLHIKTVGGYRTKRKFTYLSFKICEPPVVHIDAFLEIDVLLSCNDFAFEIIHW